VLIVFFLIKARYKETFYRDRISSLNCSSFYWGFILNFERTSFRKFTESLYVMCLFLGEDTGAKARENRGREGYGTGERPEEREE